MRPALPHLRRFSDPALDATLTESRGFLSALLQLQLPWGNYVTVTMEAGVPVSINHGLSRAPTGYLVVRRDAPVEVYDATGDGNLDHMWIQADSAVTVTLYVF